MGCQNSASGLRRGLSLFISTSIPELDSLYQHADLAILTFHKECGTMLVAIDTFETVAGGMKGVPGSMSKALITTLIAVIGDLESSGLPTRLSGRLPGLEVAQFALTHDESRRAWILWENLSGEMIEMIAEVERYFPHANECAGVMLATEAIIEKLTAHTDIRVIDLRKLMMVITYNNDALVQAAAEFHGAIARIKGIVLEAVAVLEALHKPKFLKRMKELGSAAAKIQAFDPLLVMDHFESGIKEILRGVTPKEG